MELKSDTNISFSLPFKTKSWHSAALDNIGAKMTENFFVVTLMFFIEAALISVKLVEKNYEEDQAKVLKDWDPIFPFQHVRYTS